VQADEWRRTLLEIANAVAPGWERWRARIEEGATPVREWMIRQLAPRPGDTLLELGAGPGETGFEAAAIVGDGGRLISTDLSPAMVEVARRRGAELGLRNVDYRAMDAERIELAADSVDRVLCRFAYMAMADPAAALSETHRVLRPGGRVALAVWSAAERNPWIAILAGLLVQHGHMPPPQPGDPGPFSLADEPRTRALLESAGLAVTRADEIAMRFAFRDVDEYLTFTTDTAGPVALVLRRLSDRRRDALKRRLRDAFAPFATRERYELPGVALAAVARRELAIATHSARSHAGARARVQP
jgi:ubiquinone/menaquinone biosynthesis C-methylase UbiE